MLNTVRKSAISNLKSFDNLFIELTAKSCNHRCKMCYINFPLNKKVQDFIDIETIQNALNDLSEQKLKCIYLSGAEPMTHPDFNTILRLCLKKCDVCICTNGSFINEKKARFLKKVENETDNEIIFKISLDYYEEVKNDDIRYRGAFRDAIFAIRHLVKHDFLPIVTVTNYYNIAENILRAKLKDMFSAAEIVIDNSHICINPYYDKNSIHQPQNDKNKHIFTDCQYGRTLTQNGVYSCPFLSNDYRGRCGSDFKNFSTVTPLETNCCTVCESINRPMFGINFSDFE